MIEPQRLYSLQQVCDLVPSCQRGKRLSLSCVYRWIREGRLKATKAYRWRVLGSDLIAFLGLEKNTLPEHRSPAEWDAAVAAAKLRIKELLRRN